MFPEPSFGLQTQRRVGLEWGCFCKMVPPVKTARRQIVWEERIWLSISIFYLICLDMKMM